jgi:hypothetical protein
VEGRRRKKRKSTTIDPSVEHSEPLLPELGDGWTNVEWTILEHTHDHIRNLGQEVPEKIDPTKLAEAFLRIYEKNELKLKAEIEGKEKKAFSKEEVRDRIIALRKTRDRRKSGELPPAKTLDSPAKNNSPASIGGKTVGRRISGIFEKAKFW